MWADMSLSSSGTPFCKFSTEALATVALGVDGSTCRQRGLFGLADGDWSRKPYASIVWYDRPCRAILRYRFIALKNTKVYMHVWTTCTNMQVISISQVASPKRKRTRRQRLTDSEENLKQNDEGFSIVIRSSGERSTKLSTFGRLVNAAVRASPKSGRNVSALTPWPKQKPKVTMLPDD